MADVALGVVGVPVNEDADAAAQAAGDIDFVGAEKRHIQPAELPGGEGGELGVEVAGQAENGAADVLWLDAVDANHEREELPRGSEDCLPRVVVSRRCSTDAAAEHGWLSKGLGIGLRTNFSTVTQKLLRPPGDGGGIAPRQAADYDGGMASRYF